MAHLFRLSDEAWAAIDRHLPRGKPGKPRVDDRIVISGILHVLKTGCRWRDVPPAFGPPTTIHNRSNRWSQRRSGSAFSRKWRPPVQFLTSFPSPAAMSRRTARRLVQKGGVRGSDWPFARRKNEQNPCFGRCRPVAFALTPGNVADITIAAPLLGAVARPKRLLADKAYDADSLRTWLKQRKVKAVVPSTASRRTPYPLDSGAYKRRNLIERMFCKLKNWRRIATRYDRHAQNYLSGLALAAIMIAWI